MCIILPNSPYWCSIFELERRIHVELSTEDVAIMIILPLLYLAAFLHGFGKSQPTISWEIILCGCQ